MRYLTIFAALLLVCSPGSAETLTERRVSSGDIGTLVFMAPEKWKGVEGYDDLEAAAIYEMSTSKEKFRLIGPDDRIGRLHPDATRAADRRKRSARLRWLPCGSFRLR